MFSYERTRSEQSDYLYHQFDTNLQFHPHLHRSFECIYVEEGLLELQVGSQFFDIPASHAALILPEQLHAYRTPAYSHSYLCIFSGDQVYDFTTQIRGKRADRPCFPLEDTSCISLLNTPGLNRFQIKAALYYLVGQFLQYCPLREVPRDNVDLLGQTILYVQEHFREPVSLHTAAKALGYHYNYLSAVLNRSLSMHFTELVNSYRVDYACELLASTDLPVTEIAVRSGFETIRSFNRNFILLRGQSPTASRDGLRQEQAKGMESFEAAPQ